MVESLDPSDWADFRQLAHDALDMAIDHMQNASDRPAWSAVPSSTKKVLSQPIPTDGRDLDQVLDDVRHYILPYPTGNAHPRFFGWVMGNGTPEGMLGDMIASAMNPHVGGYDQSAALVEQQVIDWLRSIMRFPKGAGGLLVSGATMANLIGLMVARNTHVPDVRDLGVGQSPSLRIYASVETHSWLERTADILGLGKAAVVRVGCTPDGKLDTTELKSQILGDRRDGLTPFCVVATAGTVDCGAVDNLNVIANICQREKLWFHIDGAFGAMLALCPNYRSRLKGMKRADSLAFDLHKWGYLQYELGCVLVKHRNLQEETFAMPAPYLTGSGRGVQPDVLHLSSLGPQLSRGFRALKVWVSFSNHGTKKFGRIIEQNIDQAQYLAVLIKEHPNLELLGPAPLNVVTFRYFDSSLPHCEIELMKVNQDILIAVQESGLAVPSSTVREGRFAIRVAITNHRTRRNDIRVFVTAIVEHGKRLTRA